MILGDILYPTELSLGPFKGNFNTERVATAAHLTLQIALS